MTPTSIIKIATTNRFFATTMLKKPAHNHYFNQTNQKTQPKQKTNPKKQPQKMLVHTELLQQQPEQNPKKLHKPTLMQPSNTEKKKKCLHQRFFSYQKTNAPKGCLRFFCRRVLLKKYATGYQAIFVWVGFYLLMQK